MLHYTLPKALWLTMECARRMHVSLEVRATLVLCTLACSALVDFQPNSIRYSQKSVNGATPIPLLLPV